MTSQSHFLLSLLRIIGQIHINQSSFLMMKIIFPYLQEGITKGVTTTATLSCYYGQLQRTGQ